MRRFVFFTLEFLKIIFPFSKSNYLKIHYNFQKYGREDQNFLVNVLREEVNGKYGKYYRIEYLETSDFPRVDVRIENRSTNKLFVRKTKIELQSILKEFCG